MLVITRKLNEAFYIGDEIKVKVVQVSRGAVRLAIIAPRSVVIMREELKGTKRAKDSEALPEDGGPDPELQV